MAISLKYGMALRGSEAIAERPDGTRVPFAALPTPLRDSEGRVTGAINVLIDISERKRSEERQRALMSVLNHRVKNTLATVQALASQTIRGRGIKRDVRAKFVERLFALSRAHDLLTREGLGFGRPAVGDRRSLAPHHGRIELHGNTMRISPKATVALSMVLHELAANAARHGALSALSGRVTLAWGIKPGKRGPNMILNWRERAVRLLSNRSGAASDCGWWNAASCRNCAAAPTSPSRRPAFFASCRSRSPAKTWRHGISRRGEGQRTGGAYIRPPSFHKRFMPRASFARLPEPR